MHTSELTEKGKKNQTSEPMSNQPKPATVLIIESVNPNGKILVGQSPSIEDF
jgi:hypothetical protein